jgi:hypothetical protein
MLKPFTLSFFASEWSVSASGAKSVASAVCIYKEEAATLTCHSFRNQIVYTLITINAKVRNYSPFSILALRAARASFSPSEVVAAWFWIAGISLLLALLARGLRGAAGVSPR